MELLQMFKKWTEEELAELRRLWWNHTPKEVFAMLPEHSVSRICNKANRMKLPRSPATSQRLLENQRKLVAQRNITVLGKERSYERARETALKYQTRTEFYRKDISMYLYVREQGLWDELCGHMAIGNFNYSESFLFECIRCLFPGQEILRNSRKIIKPYELDVYVPSALVAFEYDGSNWHNSQEVSERDAVKSKLCAAAGIRLCRIREVREQRNNPEASIVGSLAALGYDTSNIDVESCSQSAFAQGYSDDAIRQCVSKYSTLKDFRKNETSLYNRLIKRGLLDKYLSGLSRHIPDNSPERINEALAACSSSAEFREKHLGMYSAMKKYPELYEEQFSKYLKLLPPGYTKDINGKRIGRFLTFNGKTQSIADWTAEVGIPARLICKRLNCGWSLERALTEPRRIRRSQKST